MSVCSFCSIEIPASWVAAIQSNRCPACNNDIMQPAQKEILDEITKAIQEMDAGNASGLAGWIVSSFDIIKKGEIRSVEFYGAPKPRQAAAQQENYTEPQLKIANQFLKTSGADKIIANAGKNKFAEALAMVNEEFSNAPQELSVDEFEEEEASLQEQKSILEKFAKKKGGKLTANEARKALSGGGSLLLDHEGNVTNEESYSDPEVLEATKTLVEDALNKKSGFGILEADRQHRLMKQMKIEGGRDTSKSGSFGRSG